MKIVKCVLQAHLSGVSDDTWSGSTASGSSLHEIAVGQLQILQKLA